MVQQRRGVGRAAATALALLAALAASASAHIEFGNYKAKQIAEEVVSLLVVGDWGGQGTAPYTTPDQLAAASAMASVATQAASTFIVSPGGNFYHDGIQGALGARTQAAQGRSPSSMHAAARARSAQRSPARVSASCVRVPRANAALPPTALALRRLAPNSPRIDGECRRADALG